MGGISEGDSFVPLVEAFGDKELNDMLASDVCSLEIVVSGGKNVSPMRKELLSTSKIEDHERWF